MAESTEVFPLRLRDAREHQGWSQGELAFRAGLAPSAVSHFERGSRKPSFDNLRRLADTLDVTTDYLLGRVEHLKGLAGGQTMHRRLEALPGADQQFVNELINRLEGKAKKQGGE